MQGSKSASTQIFSGRRHAVQSIFAVALATAAFAPIRAAAGRCEDLASLSLQDAMISSVESVPAGTFQPPDPNPPLPNLPAFCRVVGVARPTRTSAIGFEVWMPDADWNGKFRGEGSGGSAGSISYGPMGAALQRHYATLSHDNGHIGGSWTFAQDPEKVIDFGYRAQHVATVLAKVIVRAFYGSDPQHSYFVGCSQGGHHALMEAQRYPEDYDGIIGGDPANDWTHLMVAELFNSIQASLGDPARVIAPEKLPIITAAAVANCDAKDGLADGLIVDARRCTFDPSSLACSGDDRLDCLTAAQVEAVNAIYAGPRNPRTGEQIFPGEVKGGEAVSWQGLWVGVTQPGGSSNEFFVHGVFGDDPTFDYHSFDFDRDVAVTDTKPVAGETYASALNAVDPDLASFRKRGGKLLMYHGFADGFITPLNSLDYYGKVVDAAGGLRETQQFARLFMVPGMGHCTGGPGPTTFDAVSALEQWIERGIAPDQILASHINADGSVAFTRPLCPYPQEARYRGHGSIDEASSFACLEIGVTPLPLVDSFQGSEIDSALWSVDAREGSAQEIDGALTLTPNAETGMAAVIVSSNARYDLTGSSVEVKADQVVGLGNVNSQLSILADWDNALSWWYENGFLYAVQYVAGVRTTVAALPYSAATHAWWRVREYNGTVFWETSPDGVAWTIEGASATSRLFPLLALNVVLDAATFGTGSPEPGQARYSDLRFR